MPVTDLEQLIDSLRHRSVATTAAQMREVADILERLHAVALAARALSATASGNALFGNEETVGELALTNLESALATAGYDMTDEEFEKRCGK